MVEVESMLQMPVDPDLLDVQGRTALTRASVSGHAKLVRLLLEAGANKDVADNGGRTGLQGHAEIVRFLLEDGASKDLARRQVPTRTMQILSGTQLGLRDPAQVMPTSSDCCWVPVPTRIWQTLSAARL